MDNEVTYEVKSLAAEETFATVVEGEDVPECRMRAWAALQRTLGEKLARDQLDRWVATKMAHYPNPRKGDGEGQDPEAPELACACEFTREEPGRAKFA